MGEQVTAQKAFELSLEAGLLRSEGEFWKFLGVLPAPAYMCDAEGLITYYNEHAASLWGRRPVLNSDVDRYCGSFRLYSPAGVPIPHEECWMALALRHDRAFHGEEILIEREGGDVRAVLVHASPVRDGAGALLGAVNILVDVTEWKRSEEALNEVREQLEQRVRERTNELEALNEELQSFNYSVSHDLRAPLRGIDGFSRVLEEEYGGDLDEAGLAYLSRIRSGAERMGRLIDAMLEFSGIVQGGLQKKEIDLAGLASAAIESLALREPDRRVDFIVAPSLPAYGDERLMAVALENLLENAWKFSACHDSPRIEVGAEAVDGVPVYFVRDNGTGFDMAFADRMFIPFQRLHSADRFEGTGIGLSTVRRIIHRHGGKVWAEAQPGAGATFRFTLPPRKE